MGRKILKKEFLTANKEQYEILSIFIGARFSLVLEGFLESLLTGIKSEQIDVFAERVSCLRRKLVVYDQEEWFVI